MPGNTTIRLQKPELIKELEKAGFVFSLDDAGTRVKLSYPGVQPANANLLLEQLKASRDEIVQYLQGGVVELQPLGEEVKNNDVSVEPPPDIDFILEAEKVTAELQRCGFARIYSEKLNEEIVFATDEAVAKRENQQKPATVYTLPELKLLAQGGRVSTKGLKQIHEAKKLFSGKIVSSNYKG